MTTKQKIREAIQTHAKYKNCYFWEVNTNASRRRSQEFDNSFVFSRKGAKYEVRQILEVSCKNYYFSTMIFVDGIKKDIRAIKKFA